MAIQSMTSVKPGSMTRAPHTLNVSSPRWTVTVVLRYLQSRWTVAAGGGEGTVVEGGGQPQGNIRHSRAGCFSCLQYAVKL